MLNESIFRAINADWKNPIFDVLLPVFSDKDYVVIPGAVLAGIAIYFGNRHTRLCLMALILALLVSDVGSARLLKRIFHEQRPYAELANVNLHRGGKWIVYDPSWYDLDDRKSLAFPSSHAANAAAVAAVLAFLNRRSLWLTVPIVLLVGLSRVYTGNHYPGDVLGGYVFGTIVGCSSAGIVFRFGKKGENRGPRHESWTAIDPARRTFYLLLASWTLFNFLFVHFNLFDLAGDEAQYWDWSRRLALGYYSKPPLVAYVIAVLVAAGGNQEWAIRSGAVILSSLTIALIYALTLRIARRERTALLAGAIAMAMPATWAGSVLMTIDPLLCFFWAAALYAFHHAVNGNRKFWWVVGVSLGFGLLAKYTMILLAPAFAAYLLVVDRTHWRTRGPYLALALTLLCISGVLYWNWDHNWISFRHTAGIGASEAFSPVTSLRHLAEYVGSQFGVASPILFALVLWAVALCGVRFKQDRDAALLALVFGAVFGGYALISITHAPEPNWPVCAYIAGAPALAVVWRERVRNSTLRRTLVTGLALGIALGAATRSTGLIYLAALHAAGEVTRPARLHVGPLTFDPDKDPTNTLKGGHELGEALSRYMNAESNSDPFPFSDRYQLTAWAAFYTKGRPRAYCMNMGDRRMNQYDLWGGWDDLAGRDGLFVTGGNPLKAHMFVHYMVEQGFFEYGEVVETIPVRRSGIVVRRFFLARMRTYTGKPWSIAQDK